MTVDLVCAVIPPALSPDRIGPSASRVDRIGSSRRRTVIGPRYAIFAKPPSDSDLWRFGSSIVGYDAASASLLAMPSGLPMSEADWALSASEPQRYGFHGTLKAPFHLADGSSEADLLAAARLFAGEREPLSIPELEVASLGTFLALVPAAPVPALDRLAGDCVRSFDPFRAPTTEADRSRRLAAPLTSSQIAAFDRWGYPYVFSEFRFHMTLTGSLSAPAAMRTALAERYRVIAETPALVVDRIAVFRQPSRTERFRLLAECLFAT